MSISEETIQAVRARCDIVAVVSRYVTLQKRGRSYVGLCPFHAEKTGSFNVLPERQLWHCFGCNQGGDAISFLRRIDGLSFVEAVERLAAQCGIAIERDQAGTERRSQRQQILELNEAAARFYTQQIERAPAAQEFLKRRGLSPESVAALGVGYAPAGWDTLSSALLRRGTPGELLEKAGLSLPRDSGGYYDRFRDRVMFPIRSVDGKVIAFGGRALGDVQPKYLNSPETPVFDKSRTLYGLDRAWRAIQAAGVAIVVEGYMDAAMVQQHGVLNVVATLGTALGENHLHLLQRYAPRVVLSYDGDAAGAAAAERSLALFENSELDGRILVLPAGKDPDEFVRESGVEAFRQAVDAALPLVEFQIRRLTERTERNTPEGRAALARAVAPVLVGIRSPVKREEYVRRLAEEWCAGQLYRVQEMEDAIRREVRHSAAHPGAPGRQPAGAGVQAEGHMDSPAAAPPVPPGVVRAEEFILQGLLYQVVRPETVFGAIAPDDLQVPAHRRLARKVQEHGIPAEPGAAGTDPEDDEVASLISRLALQQEKLPATAKSIEDCVWSIKERKARARIREIQGLLMQPGLATEKLSQLESEKRQLVKELSDYKAGQP